MPAFAATAKFPSAIAGAPDLLNQQNLISGSTIPTLASGIGSSDTSFTCVTGTGTALPATNFEVTLEQEIIFVATRTGDVCSGLVRGAESTSAAAHLAGVAVNAFITAQSHNQDAAEINAIETALGTNLAAITGSISVNGTVAVTPSDAAFLVNGISPVGEALVNSFPVRNNKPCMAEVPNYFALTTTHASGTIYQNTTGFPLLVMIYAFQGTGDLLYTGLHGPTTALGTTAFTFISGDAGNAGVHIAFIVPAGHFYELTLSTGAVASLQTWREFILQNGTVTDSGDLVGSRASGTIYQNNTNNMLFIISQFSGVSANSAVAVASDPFPKPVSIITSEVQNSNTTGAVSAIFIVPPGYYYKVTGASGSVAHWHEYSWNIPCTRSMNMSVPNGGRLARNAVAFDSTICVGASALVSVVPQSYLNSDPFRVRWVTMGTSTTAANTQCWINMDEGCPAGAMIDHFYPLPANAIRSMRFPVLPNYFYTFVDLGSGTQTLNFWWEYQLG